MEKTIQKAEYAGKEYSVWYRHEREYERKNAKGKVIIKGQTVAFIELEDESVIEAYAECSVRDYYNKKLGRMIAAGRLKKKLSA